MTEVVRTIKIPLHPTDEQIKLFNDKCYVYHTLGNKAVEYIRNNRDHFIDEVELRHYLTDENTFSDASFIITMIAKEKILALKKTGKVNFKKYTPTYKTFPVRCDTNGGRLSRVYFDDCINIKIPSVKGQVLISNGWNKNMISDYGNEYLSEILNCKKQAARVKFDGMHWFLLINVNLSYPDKQVEDKSLGVDVGFYNLAYCSDGSKLRGINHNKHVEITKIERRIKILQRILARKYLRNTGKTNAILKIERKIFKLVHHLRNMRENEMHNISKVIAFSDYGIVSFEDLNIRGMIPRHSRSVQRTGLRKFITYCQYKCEEYGKRFIKVDRYFPISKLCSRCGYKRKFLGENERVYYCFECGYKIDRDYNASINIMREGYRLAHLV